MQHHPNFEAAERAADLAANWEDMAIRWASAMEFGGQQVAHLVAEAEFNSNLWRNVQFADLRGAV